MGRRRTRQVLHLAGPLFLTQFVLEASPAPIRRLLAAHEHEEKRAVCLSIACGGLRPYPALKLFRDVMYAALKDKLPPDVWDYPTP